MASEKSRGVASGTRTAAAAVQAGYLLHLQTNHKVSQPQNTHGTSLHVSASYSHSETFVFPATRHSLSVGTPVHCVHLREQQASWKSATFFSHEGLQEVAFARASPPPRQRDPEGRC